MRNSHVWFITLKYPVSDSRTFYGNVNIIQFSLSDIIQNMNYQIKMQKQISKLSQSLSCDHPQIQVHFLSENEPNFALE